MIPNLRKAGKFLKYEELRTLHLSPLWYFDSYWLRFPLRCPCARCCRSLQQTTGFDPSPNNVGLYVHWHKPGTVAQSTPFIVAMHFCTGATQIYFESTQYANFADQLGFIVDAPRKVFRCQCKCYPRTMEVVILKG